MKKANYAKLQNKLQAKKEHELEKITSLALSAPNKVHSKNWQALTH
jgi:hypothetical protein